jgi:chromosome condensin MukBEF ATPase and DNA-binding subunit MukB
MSDNKSLDVGERLDESIVRLADMARTKPSGTEAMQFSQAALNLAHTKSILRNADLQVKPAESKPSEVKAESTAKK